MSAFLRMKQAIPHFFVDSLPREAVLFRYTDVLIKSGSDDALLFQAVVPSGLR
jgi:hypothetical protein